MFDTPDYTKIKTRRFNKQEQIEEGWLANAFHRPMTYYHGDKPIYPWLPPEPLVNQEPIVNFLLNYKE